MSRRTFSLLTFCSAILLTFLVGLLFGKTVYLFVIGSIAGLKIYDWCVLFINKYAPLKK
jgi:hypothetical protein